MGLKGETDERVIFYKTDNHTCQKTRFGGLNFYICCFHFIQIGFRKNKSQKT